MVREGTERTLGPEEMARIQDAELREPVRLAAEVPAATTRTLTYTVPRAGTVERFAVRFYAGAGLAVRVTPRILLAGTGRADDLVQFGSGTGAKNFIDGDDEVFDLRLRKPVRIGDVVSVAIENQDAVNAYDIACDVEIQYVPGQGGVF